MKNHWFGSCALSLCCLHVAGAAGAEVYRWTDAEGHVHFSDRDPGKAAGRVATAALPETGPGIDPELQEQRERGKKLLQVWDAERLAREQADVAAAAASAAIEQRCAAAAEQLEGIGRAQLLVRKGDDGEPIYLDDAQRRSYVQQLQAWHQQNCE